MVLTCRIRGHIGSNLSIDPEPDVLPPTKSRNTAYAKSQKIDICHLFLSFVAFYLTVMLIFSPSTIVNRIRKTNHFQAAYNIIEGLTGTATNDEIKALRKHKDQVMKLKADIAAKQYEMDKLKKKMDVVVPKTETKPRKRSSDKSIKIADGNFPKFCENCGLTLGKKKYIGMTCG